jgi:hypothetical protein
MEYPAKPSALRPISYPQEMNMPIKVYYEPGFQDPLFKQYTRKPCGESGRELDSKLKANAFLRPELIRRHRGQIFQKIFPSDPCPEGWTRYESLSPQQRDKVHQYLESDPRGYCFPAEFEWEPTFYSNKRQWYLDKPMMKGYNKGLSTPPPQEPRDFGYITVKAPPFKREAGKWSLLINS